MIIQIVNNTPFAFAQNADGTLTNLNFSNMQIADIICNGGHNVAKIEIAGTGGDAWYDLVLANRLTDILEVN